MPAMDLDHGTTVDLHNSPPAGTMSPPHPTAPSNNAPEREVLPAALKAMKHKNKGKKKRKGMTPAAPAMNVIRGFETPVASAGEDSDFSNSTIASPCMTPRGMKKMPGAAKASRLGSSTGLSALKAQLDKLNLDKDNSRPSLSRETSCASTSGFGSTSTMSSAASDSDRDRTEMESYDVAVSLESDFVSPDVIKEHANKSATSPPTPRYTAVEGGLRTQSIHRKMQAEDFEPLRCLGKGAFGTVHLVKQRATGRLYAQKQFRKAKITVHRRLIEQARNERSILESINRHAFVVKLYYAFQDHDKLYLILEYAQGGELFTHLAMERMFSEETAAFYMAEMVLALEHLHTTVRVIYRDLKPENCLLDSEGHLLLTDFGLSKETKDEDDKCNSILGTIEYMAPEVIEGKNYGMGVDYWSLGAIGFDLLTGAPPFGGNNHAKIQQNILKQKLQLPYFLGPDSKDLLTRLLRKEPNKRLGCNMPKDLKTIKQHRFFRKIDWKKLESREMEPPIQPLITDPELAENFSKEFTDLPLSPVLERNSMSFSQAGAQSGAATNGALDLNGEPMEGVVGGVGADGFGSNPFGSNPFGGFSFVASQSLLDKDDFML